ncbi:carboxypeptidase regulatory-like domain-containing protein [Siphonobacter sp. BAB-5385]|uniref:TonB-dependent receptor n=1 Tax=Siphonobacter sp. BAB-5385 TaxID=1864822 RepID=UPI0034E9619C
MLSCVSVFSNPVWAQSGIRGRVQEKQTPMASATVRLFRLPDSSFVAGTLTDESGAFSLASTPGNYFARIEFIGYQPVKTAALQVRSQALDLGVIQLSPTSNSLKEVVVQAEKSSMELTLDKRVFNVGKDLANAGGTASDILSNVPSVAVDVEGNVSLRGSSNVRILIDGRPSGLVSIKGGSGLQQLQGSAIEKIEVITNPSARYEAEGMGGVINIVLKKERQEGINGSFDVITGHPTNYGLAANVNYRRRNLNFFVNYTLAYRNTPGRNNLYQEVYRNDSTFVSRQNSRSQLKGMNNNARAGLDYYFSEKSILTAAYTWRTSKGKRFTNLEYLDYQYQSPELLATTKRTQDETETEPNSEYVLTYKKRSPVRATN